MADVGPETLGWLTVPEVAKLLKLSEPTIWRRIYSGNLESVKDGAARRVTPQALADYQKRLIEKAHASRPGGQNAA